MKKLISFVIPCYNSENTLADVVSGIKNAYGASDIFNLEVILVNDFSKDNTFGVITRLAKDDSRIKGISFSKNFGQHAAIMAGLREASGDIIVLMDDDGQTPPEEAHLLIEQVEAGHDVAIAEYKNKKHSIFRNLGSKLNNYMAKIMIGKPKDLFLSSFVAMKRYVADEVCSYKFPFPYITGMLIRTTNDIVNVEVAHKPRMNGESGYTLKKLFTLWFNGFTNFSVKPLRIGIVIGAVFAVLGFAVGIYSIIVKLTVPGAPLGWSSTISVVSFIGGIILLMLGLIGEYIGRIFMGLNEQPQYVIKSTTFEKSNRAKNKDKFS